MVKKNNRNDGDVKSFQKIIGIASLLKNEPSTSHRSENWPSPKSNDDDDDDDDDDYNNDDDGDGYYHSNYKDWLTGAARTDGPGILTIQIFLSLALPQSMAKLALF